VNRDIHEVMHQNDAISRSLNKSYYDQRHGAKASPLKVGDQVLVKQKRHNKLSTPYDPKPLVITGRKGSMVTAARGNYAITRNTSHFKQLARRPGQTDMPVVMPNVPGVLFDDPIVQNPPAPAPAPPAPPNVPNVQTGQMPATPTAPIVNPQITPLRSCLRNPPIRQSQRAVKPPVRFKDYVTVHKLPNSQ